MTEKNATGQETHRFYRLILNNNREVDCELISAYHGAVHDNWVFNCGSNPEEKAHWDGAMHVYWTYQDMPDLSGDELRYLGKKLKEDGFIRDPEEVYIRTETPESLENSGYFNDKYRSKRFFTQLCQELKTHSIDVDRAFGPDKIKNAQLLEIVENLDNTEEEG